MPEVPPLMNDAPEPLAPDSHFFVFVFFVDALPILAMAVCHISLAACIGSTF